MLNPGLPDILWSKLNERLWHATERDGLSGMIADGEIRVGVGDRYTKSFCRCQGGVCLFDFGPTATDDSNQLGHWNGWFGHQQEASIAIWLEIDRAKSIKRLLDAGTAREKWLETQSKTFIPGVEACHIGPIPMTAVAGALLIARDIPELLQQCDDLDGGIFHQIAAFELKLPPPRPDGIAERLLAGRRRAAERAEADKKHKNG